MSLCFIEYNCFELVLLMKYNLYGLRSSYRTLPYFIDEHFYKIYEKRNLKVTKMYVLYVTLVVGGV